MDVEGEVARGAELKCAAEGKALSLSSAASAVEVSSGWTPAGRGARTTPGDVSTSATKLCSSCAGGAGVMGGPIATFQACCSRRAEKLRAAVSARGILCVNCMLSPVRGEAGRTVWKNEIGCALAVCCGVLSLLF